MYNRTWITVIVIQQAETFAMDVLIIYARVNMYDLEEKYKEEYFVIFLYTI